MKKLALITVCVLGLAIAGTAANTTSKVKTDPVKKEAPVAKKMKKAPVTKTDAKKTVAPAAKAVNAVPAKPNTPAKK